MTLVGTLVAESLQAGGVLEGAPLTVTRIYRADAGDVGADQPRTWTFVAFEAPDDEADRLAHALERALDRGPWYCDFRSEEETFVVYAGRTFRYPRGDERGRAAAVAHGRSVGVPEEQLDWPE
ncbi:MAG TPA: hypothetical protein VF743_06755 [Acidimicrobiales bacterium]